jgi:hypothetical protein
MAHLPVLSRLLYPHFQVLLALPADEFKPPWPGPEFSPGSAPKNQKFFPGLFSEFIRPFN